MTNNNFLLFLLLSLLALSSCDNELNLVEPGEDIPVVYALLSATADEQFVRLERGFVDETTPAKELAQNPDEIYYDNAQVMLTNLRSNASFNLNKRNAEELGFERDTGFFPTDPNFIYHYSGNEDDFLPGDDVRLTINRGDEFEPVFTEISLLDSI